MQPDEAEALIQRDASNADVLFPYLNGEDLNTRPDQSPSRWVINFLDWPLDRVSAAEWDTATPQQRKDWEKLGRACPDYEGPVAADYPDCLDIVRRTVKPERDKVKRRHHRIRWWIYADNRPGLRSAVAGLRHITLAVQTSKYLSIALRPNDSVYSHTTIAFARDDVAFAGLLASSLHEIWVRSYSSTLETRLRYIPSDCFETFPRPNAEQMALVRGAAARYFEARTEAMRQTGQGFTALMNMFHNPAVASASELRGRSRYLDEAVSSAFGWTDIDLEHGFYLEDEYFSEDLLAELGPKDRKKKLAQVRFTISPNARKEVLKRLLKLNHERHAEELRQGLVELDKKGKVKPTKKGKQWLQKRREAERKARGVKESEHKGSGGGGRQDAAFTPATPLFGGGTEEQ